MPLSPLPLIRTAAQDKIDAATTRTNIKTQLTTASGLVTTLRTQLAAVTTGPLSSPTSVVFTLTPGRISPNLILDYATKEGKGIHDKAIITFTIIFDGAIKNIHIFQDTLNQRATDFGWSTGSGNIIDILDSIATNINVFIKYGCVTLKDIKTHAATWTTADGRQSQNNQTLLKLITKSTSPKFRHNIKNEEASCTVGTVHITTLMLKLITNKTIINTRATAAAFRRDLSNLDIYMATCNSNIELLNEHINTAVGGLSARAEWFADSMTNLFKG